MAQTYVALDLETTGLDAERDAIIEIGAARFRQDELLDTFSTFVDPGRPIPRDITVLTGITDEDVKGAPQLYDVLPGLSSFVGEQLVVGHSVDFDLRFLQQHSQQFDKEYIDTFELAGVLLPHADRYSLSRLAEMLEVELEQAHRALDDALASYRLFRAMLRRATELPARMLKEIVGQAQRAGWSASVFFREALEEAVRQPPEERIERKRLGPEGPLFSASEKVQPLQPTADQQPLNVDYLASLMEGDGAFAEYFPDYEYRPQQVEMLRAVAQAFSSGQHLLVEAPTGVGKSLAYLVPAVHWAVQNGERVVVSTNTINLQEQLYHKDLPDLGQILPLDFEAVVLKGRSHYLCPARLQALRHRGVRSPEQARVLAKVLIWLLETEDGDGDDLFLPTALERSMWHRLSADYEGCNPERCRLFQRGVCYFYRVRRSAEAAHLIIVNHALLLADVAVQNRALPEYDYLIVDEAHHLESATTNGLSFETDRATVRRLLSEIGRVSTGGRVTGLISQVLGRCQQVALPKDVMEEVELSIGQIGQSVDRALRELDLLFDHLEEFAREEKGDRSSRYAFRMRLTSGVRVQPAWDSIEIACDDANLPIKDVVSELERLAGGLEELAASYDVREPEELQIQMLGMAEHLEEIRQEISHMIMDPSSSLIYWLDMQPNSEHLSLHAAPLHVGPLVEEQLFHKKRSVVLTSATLRTGGTFDFLRERLHGWDANELAVGSPFDYQSSTLFYIVDDIPEPSERGYQRMVAQGMAELFRRTEGRALALFTSYRQLRATLRAIEARLAQAGITVQAQGEGVSRAQLLEDFRTGDRRVLLGTRSFWEGVDVPGDPLSCLAIAKLPFSVPSDPIFAARAETFEQPFRDFAVPGTVLRFLQGFGRLIRTREDRGVVACFDKRLLTKSYGPSFLESLPNPTVRRGSITQLSRDAAEWLERGGDGGVGCRTMSLTGSHLGGRPSPGGRGSSGQRY
ncbi:MAG: helicase C-terminal domain-containing protein [Anaerolineae bacterium]|jgi:DNA polymerase-3 subunit epsilon/ATP-dependent DNA helicase DinG